MQFFEDLSLIGTVAKWVVYSAAVIAALIAAYHLLRFRKARYSVIFLVVMAGIAFGAKYLIEEVWRPFPDAIPWQLYATSTTLIATVALLILGPRTKMLAAGLLISVFAAMGATNIAYQLYPNPVAFIPNKYSEAMSYEEFQQKLEASALPQHKGAKVTVPLDAPASGFKARDAEIYIPPAYWEQKAKLPVIVLMAGNPGSPSDWFNSALADRTADEYQRSHNGVAPIIASVDATGGYAANPVCADSGDTKVQTYLVKDVPAQIKQRLDVDENQEHWTIGGLSYGGTCSLQVVTNYPKAYGNFLDFSGQKEPTTGKHDETVKKFFEGSEEKFKAHNPEDLLKKHQKDGTYKGIDGKFVAGERDQGSQKSLTHLNDLAQKAGMNTEFFTVAGGHDFATWRHALQQTFEWAAQQGGIQ